MAALDWSKCPAVGSIPGKVSGAWVFKGTRTPAAIVFDQAVLEFTARSLAAPVHER